MQEYIILNLTPAFLLFIVERKKKMASELEQRENRIINITNNYVCLYNGWLVEKQLCRNAIQTNCFIKITNRKVMKAPLRSKFHLR